MENKEITKVRIAYNDNDFQEIEISYNEFNDVSGKYDSKTLNSKEMPMPELLESIDNLKSLVVNFGELPMEWRPKLKVRGFTLKTDKSDNQKIVIVASRDSNVGTCLNIATPIRALTEDNCTTVDLELIENAVYRVIDYINGHRSQQVLPLDAEENQDSNQAEMDLADDDDEPLDDDREFADETMPSDEYDEFQNELDAETDEPEL